MWVDSLLPPKSAVAVYFVGDVVQTCAPNPWTVKDVWTPKDAVFTATGAVFGETTLKLGMSFS